MEHINIQLSPSEFEEISAFDASTLSLKDAMEFINSTLMDGISNRGTCKPVDLMKAMFLINYQLGKLIGMKHVIKKIND